MQLPTVNVDRYTAAEKYKEYAAAEKVQNGYFKQKAAWYKDLKKLYFQMKSGQKVISIKQIMQLAGLHDNGTPKMAIAEMEAKIIYCRLETSGRATYTHNDNWWNWKALKKDFDIDNCYPGFTYQKHNASSVRMQAPVPLVPPQYVPKQPMAELYILWEVTEWKMVAPTDPWLVRRITDDHCVLLQGWDLTELEKSVMNAHI
jgi:hypothetical protein